MQPVWLCILWGTQFEDTFKNAQWRKTKQMQPMQLCILWGRQIKETLENTQQRGDILKFAVEKSQTNITIKIFHQFKRPIWGDIKKHTVEDSPTNVHKAFVQSKAAYFCTYFCPMEDIKNTFIPIFLKLNVRMIAFVGIMATKKGFRSTILNVAEAYNFDSWHNCG